MKQTEIKCTRCGGGISATEFDTANFVCLMLSCKECNTIVDKTWKKKSQQELE